MGWLIFEVSFVVFGGLLLHFFWFVDVYFLVCVVFVFLVFFFELKPPRLISLSSVDSWPAQISCCLSVCVPSGMGSNDS